MYKKVPHRYMTKKQKRFFYNWPGGIKNIAGGTRSLIKLDRPWQKEIGGGRGTCPFCSQLKKSLKKVSGWNGWHIIENKFTPYAYHRMVLPRTC